MVILIPVPMMSVGSGAPLSKREFIGLGIATAAFLGTYFTIPLTARAMAIDLPGLFGLAVAPEASQIFYMFLIVLTGILGVTSAIVLAAELPSRWWIWVALGAVLLAAVLWIPVLGASLEALNAEYCREFIQATVERLQDPYIYVSGCIGIDS